MKDDDVTVTTAGGAFLYVPQCDCCGDRMYWRVVKNARVACWECQRCGKLSLPWGTYVEKVKDAEK